MENDEISSTDAVRALAYDPTVDLLYGLAVTPPLAALMLPK